MPSADFMDSWFRMVSSGLSKPIAINFPGSGSIGGFNYQPYTTWEAPSLYRGNIGVEQAVYNTVASPGKQLGKLTDAVIALADLMEKHLQIAPDTASPEKEKLDELREMCSMIERLKEPVVENLEQTAREDFAKLLKTNKKLAQSLLDELQREIEQTRQP